MKNHDKVVDEILKSDKVKRYKELEKVINNNKEISKKMDELKDIQKQIIHAEKLMKKELLDKLNQQYDTLTNEIHNYPLMAEYMDLQVEINDFLQNFKMILENGLDGDFTAK